MTSSNIAEIANVDTGNIDYTTTTATGVQEPPTVIVDTSDTQPTVQNITAEQQVILNFYQAVNTIDTVIIHTMADAHLNQSNVFTTYYSKNRLSKFTENVLAPKIVVTNIQEKTTNSTNPNIKDFTYTLEYTLASNQQKFTEERSTVLIKK